MLTPQKPITSSTSTAASSHSSSLPMSSQLKKQKPTLGKPQASSALDNFIVMIKTFFKIGFLKFSIIHNYREFPHSGCSHLRGLNS
jgi:hypothetical protein